MLNIAIVGAGAAGIMAASILKKHNVVVDLYEKNASIGKKILASGNGRCNIHNTNITDDDYFGEDVSFARRVIKRFEFGDFQKFCLDLGLMLDVKDDGRVYPLSDEAKSVLSIFEAHLRNSDVNILCNMHVLKIEKRGEKFELFNQSGLLGIYDRVLITSGLLAAPQLGGTKDGMDIAQSFGHSVNKPYPALVSLELEGNLFKKMSGVKHSACVSLYIDKKKIEEMCGDVLFTQYGISGFAVLDISTKASFYLLKKRMVEISINFFPYFDRQYISRHIEKSKNRLNGYTALEVLSGILPIKIAKAILKKAGIEPETDISQLSTGLIKKLTNELFNLKFKVVSTHGFEYAEASGGGIRTCEVDVGTMESKLIKGLFFAGEVLDIVGRRGGYNFAFAFASGFIAASSILKKGD